MFGGPRRISFFGSRGGGREAHAACAGRASVKAGRVDVRMDTYGAAAPPEATWRGFRVNQWTSPERRPLLRAPVYYVN